MSAFLATLARVKYKFREGEPRQRFRSLIVRAMNALARAYGGERRETLVGWHEYAASADPEIAAIDEGIFEVASLIASLADVDGSVVMTKRWELLGFGGEISGELADVPLAARALDVEAQERHIESTDGVGTRHRSVYRLCNAFHDAMAVVVSQDGGARFVRWMDGHVTYWDQVATGPLEY